MALNKVTSNPVEQAALAIFKEVSQLPSKVAEATTEGAKNVAVGFDKFSKVAGQGMARLFVGKPMTTKSRAEILADSICKLCSGEQLSTAGLVMKKVIDSTNS